MSRAECRHRASAACRVPVLGAVPHRLRCGCAKCGASPAAAYPVPVQTMIANGAVVVWAVALIFAPGLLHATFCRCTPLTMSAGAMLTMALVALVFCVVSIRGYSPIPWLVALGAFLVLPLVALTVR